MQTLTDIAIRKQTAYLSELISHAEYELEGVTKQVSLLRKNVRDNEVKFYIYFDDGVVGSITNIRLVDVEGDVAVESNHTFNKEAQMGLYILFQYRLIEEEDIDGI